MDELERILVEDEGLEPSSGLTDAVMRAVLDEAQALPPIAFPWPRFVIGVGGCLLLLLAGVVLALWQGLPELAPATVDSRPLDPGLAIAVGAPLGALLLALVSFRWSMLMTR